jgi:hypothetical protein
MSTILSHRGSNAFHGKAGTTTGKTPWKQMAQAGARVMFPAAEES